MLPVLVASAVVVFVVAVVVVVVVILCLQLDAEVVCHNTHQGVDPNHPEKLKNEEIETRTKYLKSPVSIFTQRVYLFSYTKCIIRPLPSFWEGGVEISALVVEAMGVKSTARLVVVLDPAKVVGLEMIGAIGVPMIEPGWKRGKKY